MKDCLKHALKSAVATVDLAGMCGSDSVLFTFDDGPDPRVTPAVLELLRGAGARGVFFIVGNRIPRAPHMLKRILDEGHLLGNHTFDHGAVSLADLRACQRAIHELTGHAPKLFRPALGKLTAGTIACAWRINLRTVLWSVDSGDWRAKDAAARDTCAHNLGARLLGMETRREIVLLHDDNPASATALQACLPPLMERGCDLSGAVARLA